MNERMESSEAKSITQWEKSNPRARETQKGPSMRFVDSILGALFKPINRRQFQTIVDRHDGDAYDKSFKSWDHLVALIFAQLSGIDSLRGLETAFNANAQHHYHLSVGELAPLDPVGCQSSDGQSRSLPRPSRWWRPWSIDRRAAKAPRWCG